MNEENLHRRADGSGTERSEAGEFEALRPHLRAVAYRMLGSLSQADDAVQEAWLRFDRADTTAVENLGGWLTTVVGRICLDVLRSRKTRREESLDALVHIPDPIVSRVDAVDPERQALLADSVGIALLVVLEALTPAERLAFVLHDLFSVPFDEIAPIVGRNAEATRQLASRARRRIAATPTVPDADLPRQRVAVDAFFAAAHDGDFDSLVAVLDPDVVLSSDGGPHHPEATALVRGAVDVGSRAITFRQLGPFVHPVLVNGAAGVVVAPGGRPASVLAFTVIDGRIARIDALGDPDRVPGLTSHLDLT